LDEIGEDRDGAGEHPESPPKTRETPGSASKTKIRKVKSSPLRVRSFAKINLALSILGRRRDGYHDIRTIFQSIDISDQIELQASPRLELESKNLSGVPVEDNLVWKAAKLLAAKFGERRGAAITLSKRIPPGSGLGGGSSNAAAALLGLCRLWGINASDADLLTFAADLGSDVPFFLHGGTALGTGRGEEIHPLPDPPLQHLVVIFPGVHVSTAEAYGSLNLGLTSSAEDHRIQHFRGRVEGNQPYLAGIFNDFEKSILPAHPRIREAKNLLEAKGATAALLSGSGSSVFGFFPDEESALEAARLAAKEAEWVFPAKTLSRAEYFQNMFG
jgi:4-diphosphocytidyl-2-C-methyl-D-erythritol kinase